MDAKNPLEQAKRRLGLGQMAKICGVSRTAVDKWVRQGHLPRTEWTGETSYASLIAAAYEVVRAQAPELGEEVMTRERLLAARPVPAKRQEIASQASAQLQETA